MIIGFKALSAWEQTEVLRRLTELRLRSEADDLSEAERILASLQRVAELVGKEPAELTADDYRAAIKNEIEQGQAGIEPISQVMRPTFARGGGSQSAPRSDGPGSAPVASQRARAPPWRRKPRLHRALTAAA